MNCPCHSGLPYEECCAPYHLREKQPENALKLMRSRYSAYALGNDDYIIDTTHPDNPSYQGSRMSWRQSILDFCKKTQFNGLDILSFSEEDNEAHVTFIALLTQSGADASFREKSRFCKVDGRWLYHSGVTTR